MILESNQNHATAKETEICPTLPASTGAGGGYVPMLLVEPIVFRDDITIKVDGGGHCLLPRHNAQGTSDYDLSESDRDAEPRRASGQLQRTRCL